MNICSPKYLLFRRLDRVDIKIYLFKALQVFILMSKGKRLSRDILMVVLSFGSEYVTFIILYYNLVKRLVNLN